MCYCIVERIITGVFPSPVFIFGILGVTRQTIIAIENDKYDPTLELAMKISEFFGKSVNDIFQLSH